MSIWMYSVHIQKKCRHTNAHVRIASNLLNIWIKMSQFSRSRTSVAVQFQRIFWKPVDLCYFFSLHTWFCIQYERRNAPRKRSRQKLRRYWCLCVWMQSTVKQFKHKCCLPYLDAVQLQKLNARFVYSIADQNVLNINRHCSNGYVSLVLFTAKFKRKWLVIISIWMMRKHRNV